MKQVQFFGDWVLSLNDRMQSTKAGHTAARIGEAEARLMLLKFQQYCEHYTPADNIIRLSTFLKLLGAEGFSFERQGELKLINDRLNQQVELGKRSCHVLVLEHTMDIPIQRIDGVDRVNIYDAQKALAWMIKNHVGRYSSALAALLFGDGFYDNIAGRKTIMMELHKRLAIRPAYESFTLEQDYGLAAFNNAVLVDWVTVDTVRDHLFAIAERYREIVSSIRMKAIKQESNDQLAAGTEGAANG